jgi:hypothetical protein
MPALRDCDLPAAGWERGQSVEQESKVSDLIARLTAHAEDMDGNAMPILAADLRAAVAELRAAADEVEINKDFTREANESWQRMFEELKAARQVVEATRAWLGKPKLETTKLASDALAKYDALAGGSSDG